VSGGQSQSPAKPAALDRNAFTFLNWNLDVRIETKTESFFSRGKITLRNDSPIAQNQVALQISSSLKWASIKENRTAVPFTASQVRSDLDHSGNVQEAIASLSSPVPPGGSIELEVGYSGTISLDTTRLAQLGVPLEIRAATDYDRITPTFTCLRGVGHVLWFPVSIEPAIMGEGSRLFDEISAWAVRHSSSSMTLGIPSDVPPSMHTNAQFSFYEQMGVVADEQHQWKHIGLAGPVIVAGNYQQLTARQNQGGAAFVVTFFPDHQPEADDYARVIHETVPMVSGKSNFPTAMIELPEAQDSTFDADSVLLTPLKPIDRKSLELTIVFMLAHQTLWSPRAWIYEGAAHLAQVLERERQDGRAAAIAYMEQRLAPLTIADSGTVENAKSSSLINTTNEVFYRTKAMYVWWMLREIVGERALLDSLEQYDPAADKEPSYIQKLLEKNSHKDLEWFFDDWVYQDRGIPEFTVSNGYARASLQGIFLVSATIENKGGAAAEVQVIVHTERGDVVTRLRVPGHGKAAARVEVNSRPTEVTVNDGSVPEIDRSDNTTPVRIAVEPSTS
jgi:hypothetical protein